MAQLGKSAHQMKSALALIVTLRLPYNGDMYAGKSPLFTVNQGCLAVSNKIVQEMDAVGLVTRRTFDLHLIRSEEPAYLCPIHGLSDCTCQFVILLVSLHCGYLLTIILEGSDQQTRVYLDLGQEALEERVDPMLIDALSRALFSPNPVHGHVPL